MWGGLFISAGALRIPTHIGDNPSHLQDAQFVGSRSKYKCFSLASFGVKRCVSSAFKRARASDKARMDTFTRSADVQQTLNIGTRDAFDDDGSRNIATCIFGEDTESVSSKTR